MSKLDLNGIIPAPVLPITKDYQIAEDDLRNYIHWLLEQKPKGVAINVDTGGGGSSLFKRKKEGDRNMG